MLLAASVTAQSAEKDIQCQSTEKHPECDTVCILQDEIRYKVSFDGMSTGGVIQQKTDLICVDGNRLYDLKQTIPQVPLFDDGANEYREVYGIEEDEKKRILDATNK